MFRIASFLIVLLLCSCKPYQQIEISGIKGFELNKINAQGIDGNIHLSIKNPNPIGFSIFKSEFDVTYSGVYLGKARLDKKVKISAGEEKVYSFNISNDFKDINLVDVMKLLSGGSFKNELLVKGDLNAGKLFVRKKIPVDLKEKIKLN